MKPTALIPLALSREAVTARGHPAWLDDCQGKPHRDPVLASARDDAKESTLPPARIALAGSVNHQHLANTSK